MPNIRELNAPAGIGLNPTETGIEATAGAARRIGGFYNQAAEAQNTVASIKQDTGNRIGSTIKDVGSVAVDYEDHQEISHGALRFANLQDDLTQQWNATVKNADPNDPAVAKKFREEVLEPALDNFKEGFNTENSQKFADQRSDALRNHFFEKTSADMSTLAGIAVQKNISQSTTAMSNTAMMDPSSVPSLLAGTDHSISAMVDSSPTLRPTDAARVKVEISDAAKKAIVHAGAVGAIQKSTNPEATADEWINKYPDYISGADAKQLAGNARQQIRANNYDADYSRKRDKQVVQDRSADATAQYLIDVRSQDPKLANDPTAKRILNDPTLTNTDKNNLLNYVDRQMKPETDARLSQQTFVNLLRDMRDPNADSDKIMQQAWDARLKDPGAPGSMTEKDFNSFRQEVVARKTPEGAAIERDRAGFFKNYASAIVGNTYNPSIGDPKLYNAEQDARRMEGMLRSKGLDPHLAYDPASEYFLGRTERLSKWQSSMQVDLTTRATASSGDTGAAAAKPSKPEVPFELRGVADLSYSKARNMWRDNVSGKLYDAGGKEAK